MHMQEILVVGMKGKLLIIRGNSGVTDSEGLVIERTVGRNIAIRAKIEGGVEQLKLVLKSNQLRMVSS